MTDTVATLNHLWAGLLVEELVRNGVDAFCISPGSRCTPLTLAAARNTGARCVVHFDERGAGYFALGYARAAGKPAALVCTSGTAAANYYPAIVEASRSRCPLIVLTADRPPELRDTGANQTILQAGMFGPYTRWRFDLPCPAPDISRAFVLTTVDQAVYRATGPEPGPVHLNCPYREPFVPDEPAGERDACAASPWRGTRGPYTAHAPVRQSIEPSTATRLRELMAEARRPVVAVGQLNRSADRAAAAALVSRLRCPVFPDVASGLRLGCPGDCVISHFDLLLSSPETARALQPDLLIHVGGAMVSKSFQRWLERCPPAHCVRITDHPERDDPAHAVSWRIQADIPEACEAIAACGIAGKGPDEGPGAWLERIRAYQDRAARVLDGFFSSRQELMEPAVARCIAALAGHSDGLFLGNSMPIRDAQRYASADGSGPVVFANRGASGIDGNIATAAGAAFGSGRALTAVLGDLAALHDLNSLALLRDITTPVALVIINNNGGGIFHFLPVSSQTALFERYFATPHGLSFETAAGLFGLTYANPDTLDGLSDAYGAALGRAGATLIEIRTGRAENAALHKAIDEQVFNALHA